jgi:Glycosyl hydrolases family 43
MKKFNHYYSFFLLLLFTCFYSSLQAQFLNIKNDVFWNTKDNQPIYSQGGGIFKFIDAASGKEKYFWYGVNYEEADIYRNNPTITLPNATFKSVTCYSSTDLVNWTFEADVFTKAEAAKLGKFVWVGRLGVAYIKELTKYVLFVQHDKSVLIATADKPNGEFTWHQKISMQNWIGFSSTGDQTVFTDEDSGTSYLVYSKPEGRNKMYISEIGVKEGMVNLLDCTKIFEGESREGNCLFKYNNKYYMNASNIYGWDGSFAYYLVADNVKGPYTPKNNMQIMKGCEDDFAHISQTGFFVNVKGTKKETVIFCGDRWANFAGNGLGYNQWVPLSFEGTTPYFNSLNAWMLNEKTGIWKVANGNNFVQNGSFEADRRYVPTHTKPDQIFLTGWITEVIEGNTISLDSTTSPVINYFNTEEDRKIVIGEKSLQIKDNVNFKRKISQLIASSPYVKLKDGTYTLTAKVKNSSGFAQLEMYAMSKGKMQQYAFTEENATWITIRIEGIKVRKGKVEIGFLATGNANAFCYVDDVTLIKN